MSIRIRFLLLLLVIALVSTPTYAALTQQCSWGATAPAVHPQSVNVISTPIVLNLIGPNHSFAHIAFISYETSTNLAQDSGGCCVLWIATAWKWRYFPMVDVRWGLSVRRLISHRFPAWRLATSIATADRRSLP